MMRRCALLGTLLLLGGCSGLGHFFADTEQLPGTEPNAPGGISENLQRARGAAPTELPIEPQAGNVWPGPPQPLPSLSDVSRGGFGNNGLGGGAAAMPSGGSMSMGEQQSIRGGVPLDNGGFSGGAGLSSSVPDPARSFHGNSSPSTSSGTGNIVIPNGDGTSTVISPDGSVKTVKGTPK